MVGLQAVEVRSPSSAYELLVKTTVARGRPTPRGRLTLPRDPRKNKEIILIFADPERAKDALAAGAAYAGGLELVDKVRLSVIQLSCPLTGAPSRSSRAK